VTARSLHALAIGAAVAALGGCGGGDEPAAPQRPAAEVVAAGDPSRGREVFSDNCSRCHGEDGGGGGAGPALAGTADAADADRTVRQIREGGGGMPSFGGDLSEDELADVSAYVVEDLARR
jgi:cytochrome c551